MTPNKAWAAGFLDGLTRDGLARISVVPKQSESPRVVVVLDNREPLVRLERLFGGQVANVRVVGDAGGKGKTVFRWTIAGARAMHMIVEILPGLYLQKDRARAALYYGWYDGVTKPSIWRRLFTRKQMP